MATDTFRDAKIDSDRDIIINAGDIGLTTGVDDNVSQSVSILAGDVIRDVIGGQLTAKSVERIRSTIEEVLQDDVQIEDVASAEITEINKAEGTVTVRVVLLRDTNFTIEVNV